jgi:VWFA-related protein
LVAAGGLALCVFGLAAQQSEKPQDPGQPPRFRVDANFVRVDVYPLKDGKPLLGLRAEDFEVYEDGTAQKIDTFEHVVVRPAGPQADRIEPGSQRESLQAAANPRNRVFVIFLDTPHVMIDSAHRINEPLIRLIDRILGPDDLVGVMTPAMAASQVVLARKTLVIEDSLRRNWAWGDRFTLQRDKREQNYLDCFPPLEEEITRRESVLASEMIARKRERATLEALEDLVRYLRTIREERKAILTVTEGWLLYRENPAMMKLREGKNYKEAVPGVEPIRVGPGGTLGHKDRSDHPEAMTLTECNADRMKLATMNNERYFREIMDEANFANASFYPIDPRGLAAFDNPIGPDPPPPITVDAAMLRNRIEAMQTLASNTDGMAVVNSNDLDAGLRRISDDLTSYYLLGYSSTNTKLDGRFRSLRVRVKQPGVEVRARRGYKAATESEVTAARKAADAPVPEATLAVRTALDKLNRVRPETRFRIHAITSAGDKPLIWIAGELQSLAGRPDDFVKGATVDIEATSGGTSTTTRVTLKPGERAFLTTLALPAKAAGDISLRARLAAVEGSVMPFTDTLRAEIASMKGQPLLYRRSVSTGNRLQPTADFRFSRTERVRIEIPVGSEIKPGPGRVLDRAGVPLQVPVTTGERLDEASGQRWITADVSLAPLSLGDYAVEVQLTAATTERVLTPVRVTR